MSKCWMLTSVLLLAILTVSTAHDGQDVNLSESNGTTAQVSPGVPATAAPAPTGPDMQPLLEQPPLLQGTAAVTSDNDNPTVQFSPPQQALRGSSSSKGPARAKPHRYIVQLATAPAAAIIGPPLSAAAAAAAGAGPPFRDVALDVATSQAVLAHTDAVAASAGVAPAQVSHRYSYALSGFTVQNPSASQLAALTASPDVVSVTPDRVVRALTYTTPQFLGLAKGKGDPAGGLWQKVRMCSTPALCADKLTCHDCRRRHGVCNCLQLYTKLAGLQELLSRTRCVHASVWYCLDKHVTYGKTVDLPPLACNQQHTLCFAALCCTNSTAQNADDAFVLVCVASVCLQLGGALGSTGAGEGVVIGVIDTG